VVELIYTEIVHSQTGLLLQGFCVTAAGQNLKATANRVIFLPEIFIAPRHTGLAGKPQTISTGTCRWFSCARPEARDYLTATSPTLMYWYYLYTD
jgi:hypothetical protein